MLHEGDVIGGKYRIGKMLATGGQSRVYLAHTETGVCWAIKEIRTEADTFLGRLFLKLGLRNLGATRVIARLARQSD